MTIMGYSDLPAGGGPPAIRPLQLSRGNSIPLSLQGRELSADTVSLANLGRLRINAEHQVSAVGAGGAGAVTRLASIRRLQNVEGRDQTKRPVQLHRPLPLLGSNQDSPDPEGPP
ncbi:MAG: hypothetical protein K0S99_2372 [Thermomicrobiales bacterium]|jgi:hypothetical protein|nr:hypothetical protein [Thermomicrobiales bacterium]